MRVSIIAAVARNGTIGIDNRLPWRLPADLRRFKSLTMGHHLVMGRKTFESVGALAGRTTIVVTRRGLVSPPPEPGVKTASSLEGALDLARAAGEEEIFVAGGAEIYREALGLADRMYLTRIDADFAGDATFPPIDDRGWRELEARSFGPDEKNPHPFAFVLLERRSAEGAVPRGSGAAAELASGGPGAGSERGSDR
ncbi:MAG TPA: dihydrofolate reductase [Thermoanaerobaculia bacterium]|nr:dihydrofolate reductase [Thermoanaerobaculia bacterium]